MFLRSLKNQLWALGAGAALSLSACGPESAEIETGKTSEAEQIDSTNDPNRFNLSFRNKASELPAGGESLRKPFPSNWWPMSRGGGNQRWQGANVPSPLEQYDRLANPDTIKSVQLTLAKKNWKDEPVNADAQPETMTLGAAGEWEHKNHGRYGTVDPEGWWGHCNGWASYVLNEDEPTRPVWVKLVNGAAVECAANAPGCVKFELGDINFLGAELYWSDAARMLGRRCEVAESEFKFDASGRVDNVECRDGNAASFHLVTTNMIGLLERPYIVDLTADREVWNFPIYKYSIDRQAEISVADALREMGAPEGTTTWTYNANAKKLLRVTMRAWIVEDSVPPTTQPTGAAIDRYTTIETYEYILELDANDVIIGGEWVGRSKTKHPDFLWYSYRNSTSTTDDDRNDRDNPHVRYSVFKSILTAAQRSAPPPADGVVRVEAAPNLAIPDNNAAGLSHALEVPNAMTAATVRLRATITHTYRGDLKVILAHNGTEAIVHNNAGGGEDDLSLDLDVPQFANVDAKGTWTLKIIDTAAQDTGSLVRWSLDLTPTSGGSTGGGNTGGGDTTPRNYGLTPNAAIPDNNQAGLESRLTVGDSFAASRVKLSLDITHTYRGDLHVSLEHAGKTKVVSANAGGSADDLRTTIEIPELVGDVGGDWILRVKDTAAQDTGVLKSWSLELTPSGGSSGGSGGTVTPIARDIAANLALAIPDNNATGVTGNVEVAEDILIESLKVTLDVTHTYIGDLLITIEKGGIVQTLHANAGGGTDNLHATFDTSAFGNLNARGTWKVKVVDNAAQDTGTLDKVTLKITGRRP